MSDFQALFDEACQYWATQSKHYGHDGSRPLRIQGRLQAILAAPDLAAAQEALRKFRDSAFIYLMSEWKKHRIPGPDEPRNWEKKARQAQSLAKMFGRRGDLARAQIQQDKAEQYLQRAAQLKLQA